MAIKGTIQVAPVKSALDKNQKLCLCKTLSPIFSSIRLLGLFPISWNHTDQGCTYKKSMPWLMLTLLLVGGNILLVLLCIDLRKTFDEKCLIILLHELTNTIYGMYVIMLGLYCFWRAPKWINTLNKFVVLLKSNVFCQSAMQRTKTVEYAYLAVFILIVLVNLSLLFWMSYSERYSAKFSALDILWKMQQVMSFAFYTLFLTFVLSCSAVLACFEKYAINSLKFVSIHPKQGVDQSNNVRDFLGIIRYKQCRGRHQQSPGFTHSQPELIEYLRILHEEICLCIYSFNECMNPIFLFHTVIELTVLIIHAYAAVAYFVYTFKHPLASAVQVINYVFLFFHSIGMLVFLRNAQQLKNMITGLINFLLEYSTAISSVEEHQQIRLFVEKLKHHRHLSASGVFEIDLGIAGPISANILTYVLVALQFEIPQE